MHFVQVIPTQEVLDNDVNQMYQIRQKMIISLQ